MPQLLNIVIVFTDDQATLMLEFLSEGLKTPNLDLLAREAASQ
ncbi:MAG: hypothetical protein U1F83_20445 [Verrucomicrobiota bacterium]